MYRIIYRPEALMQLDEYFGIVYKTGMFVPPEYMYLKRLIDEKIKDFPGQYPRVHDDPEDKLYDYNYFRIDRAKHDTDRDYYVVISINYDKKVVFVEDIDNEKLNKMRLRIQLEITMIERLLSNRYNYVN